MNEGYYTPHIPFIFRYVTIIRGEVVLVLLDLPHNFQFSPRVKEYVELVNGK
jgi:hypothetical protein